MKDLVINLAVDLIAAALALLLLGIVFAPFWLGGW